MSMTNDRDAISRKDLPMSQVFRLSSVVILLLVSFVTQVTAQGQTTNDNIILATVSSPDNDAGKKEPEDKKESDPKSPAKSKQINERASRWIDVQTFTISVRFRFVANSAGVTTASQVQHNFAFKSRFKFDTKGNYSINVGVFTGNNFTGGWSNTGPGNGDLVTNLYLKQMYFSAKPVKGLEFQVGSIYVNRGENTEITSYDNDAYLVGERVSIKRPKQLFFDEISVTNAYLGDLKTPNLNKRWHRIKESNYHQLLVSKKIGERATFSMDYTFQSGVDTLHEAIKISTKELRLVDSIRFENYQRVDGKRDAGFALSGEKTLFKKLTLSGGFARIDREGGTYNSDRFDRGKRLFLNASYNISPEFGVHVFATRAFDNPYPISNRTRLEFIFSYNVLKSLHRIGLL